MLSDRLTATQPGLGRFKTEKNLEQPTLEACSRDVYRPLGIIPISEFAIKLLNGTKEPSSLDVKR
ncbi:MAG: hypothetical protein AB1673_15475 [Actinomycetota bacterium]